MGSTAPDYFEICIPYNYTNDKCFSWALYVEATWSSPSGAGSNQMEYPNDWGGLPACARAAWCDWKNTEVWLSGRDIKVTVNAPSIPWLHRNFTAINADVRDLYYMNPPDDNRTSFRDDWCKPDYWSGETIYPYPSAAVT
jgi:hypothetical protein